MTWDATWTDARLRERPKLSVGIHEIDVAAYHADPCEEPSLSSSGIKLLLSSTPAHFRAQHPRLTEWPIADEPSDASDLGSVVHRLLLQRGAEFEVHDVPDWRGKRADLRDASRANGRIPIKRAEFERAQTIAAHAERALAKRFGAWPIGQSEQTLIWRRTTDYGEIWCRALVDHLSLGSRLIDLKTTAQSLDDDSLAKKIAFEGIDIQAAWYIDGFETIYPEESGRASFILPFIEVDPPYAVSFVELPEGWLTRARFRIARAANTFAACLQSGEWPGWAIDRRLNPPAWLETKWEAEELGETA